MNLVDKLKTNKIISSIEEMKLDSESKKTLLQNAGAHFVKRAVSNARKLNFYKIVYKSQGHNVIGFIVQPKNIDGRLPVVIYNRGGSNDFGSLNTGTVFSRLGFISSWGYVVFASQYSGGPGSEGVDEFGGGDIEDVLNLKKIINIHPNADTDKIGMVGGSRGGMMTYLSLARVKWLKVAVSSAGSANLVDKQKYRPKMQEHYKNMFGGKKKDMIARSAIYWPEKFNKKTPLLLMHGTADWRVNVMDSITLAGKLYEQNVPYKLIVYPGADHALTEVKEESDLEIKKWLDKYLKNSEALPDLKKHGR